MVDKKRERSKRWANPSEASADEIHWLRSHVHSADEGAAADVLGEDEVRLLRVHVAVRHLLEPDARVLLPVLDRSADHVLLIGSCNVQGRR